MREDSNKRSESSNSDQRVDNDILNNNANTENMRIPQRNTSRKSSFISTKWRWLILIAISMISFGPYFCEFNMNTLSMKLSEKLFSKEFKYNILHPISSICGMFASITAGILISKKKLKILVVLFLVSAILSQVFLTTVGFYVDNQDSFLSKSFTLKIFTFIGYFLYGLGVDGSQVCQMSMIGMMFAKQEISTGYGITLSVLRISFLLNLIVPDGDNQLGLIFLIGLILCIVSLFFGIISIIINAYSKKIDIQRKVDFEEDEEQEFHWRNMLNFGWSFWILSINCTTFYSSLLGFSFFSTDLICQKYDICDTPFLSQYVFLGSVLMSPIFGYLTDFYGYKITSLAISSVLLMIAHLLNILPILSHYWCLISLGLMMISYSLYYVTFWPSISLIAQYEMIGYAYGVCNTIQNCGLFIFPFASSIFIKNDGSSSKYQNIEIILLILAFIAFISSIILWRVDKKMYRSILQLPCMKIIKQPSKSFRIVKPSRKTLLNNQESSSFSYQ